MKQNKIIVAIDGYSSSGKSSMAKWLAARIGYRYIDSGAMYRAVTLFAMNNGLIDCNGIVDAETLGERVDSIEIDFAVMPDGQHTLLNGADVEKQIRSLEVSAHVSPVAAIPQIRKSLTSRQKEFGTQKGIVMDGRDIGTTVFPHAEMKVFVTASPETRARRRLKELEEKGMAADYESVLANVIDRDHIDETRAESPLRKAPDAVVLDNSDMTPAMQHEWLLNLFNSIVSNPK